MKRTNLRLIISMVLLLLLVVYLYFVEIEHYSDNAYTSLTNTFEGELQDYIGGEVEEKDAYFFFIDKNTRVVGSRFTKNIFGWKLKSSQTGSSMELNTEQTMSAFHSGELKSKEKFLFGLTSIRNIDRVLINDQHLASLIPLVNINGKYPGNKNSFIWYSYFTDTSQYAMFNIKVFDESNQIIYETNVNF